MNVRLWKARYVNINRVVHNFFKNISNFPEPYIYRKTKRCQSFILVVVALQCRFSTLQVRYPDKPVVDNKAELSSIRLVSVRQHVETEK